MTTGSRAVWLAVVVVVLGAVLAWLLSDGGVFTTATSSSILGKFGYDAVRDFPKAQKRETEPEPPDFGHISDEEEYGD